MTGLAPSRSGPQQMQAHGFDQSFGLGLDGQLLAGILAMKAQGANGDADAHVLPRPELLRRVFKQGFRPDCDVTLQS